MGMQGNKQTESKGEKKMTEMIKNQWASKMTTAEVANWISAMIEIERYEICGYWESAKMVRCPFGRPLAIVR